MAGRESIFSDDDAGELVFSDDVKDVKKMKAFLEAAGDVEYQPIPIEGEGPYPDVEDSMLTLLHWAAWYKEAETIKLLTGIGQPLLGRVLVGDAAAGRWDVLPFAAKEE